jgi:hypothetical protein
MTHYPGPKIAYEPSYDAEVSGVITVRGTSSNLPKNAVIWILTMQSTVLGERRFWPQTYNGTGAITPLTNGNWSGKAWFSPGDVGRFEIWAAIVTDSSMSKYLEDYIDSNKRRTPIPILGFSSGPPPLKDLWPLDSIRVRVVGK